MAFRKRLVGAKRSAQTLGTYNLKTKGQMQKLRFAPIILFTLLISRAEAQTSEAVTTIDTIVVTGISPLPGTPIDADKIAGEVQSISVQDLEHDRQVNVLPNAIATQFSSVSLNDEQGSQFQPDFVYRGFEASPISGVSEGLAVYQDGVRLNESFGDNVNWDLVPEFAVNRFSLQSNNPVFGLNALGGAVTLEMKNGLNFEGTQAELSGGSFGDITGNAEYGSRFGNFGVYLGIGAMHDDGFRYQSPTTLRQIYGDVADAQGPLTLHFSVSGALNDIAAVGPTPVEMLAQDRRSVFTYPQAMRNEAELVQFHGGYEASEDLNFSFNAYFRHFHQRLIDGNTTDVTNCENDTAQLCLEGDDDFPGDALYDTVGNAVPASVLPAGATPGETDFTHTNTNSAGAAAQVSLTAPIGGHANSLVIGGSVDYGMTNYKAYGELGSLEPSLEVIGAGVIIDQSRSPTAQPPIEAPVDVDARNTYGGLYAIDVFDISPKLSWTLSGRLNTAQITLLDRLGDTLNGSHSFSRFNPGTGLTYKIWDQLTAYAGYSESNRAPTAGELSCADPTSPCLLDAFLVSDPDLKQVVSHNYEFGLRGSFTLHILPGRFSWNASAYRTNASNDILLLATDINGFGYFQNAGTTRHQGADLHMGYTDEHWKLAASYSYLQATFQNSQILSSNSPSADSNGLIYVQPGNQVPMNPNNRLTLSADYAVTSDFIVGTDIRLQSGQYLVGDASNQQPKLPGYTTLGLRTSYQINSRLSLFAQAENLFDRNYSTYGSFTQLDGLPPNLNLSNPRTYSPAPGRLFFGGVRLGL
jgi:outer membrane receptor protein involved in Fe transport